MSSSFGHERFGPLVELAVHGHAAEARVTGVTDWEKVGRAGAFLAPMLNADSNWHIKSPSILVDPSTAF